MFNNNERSILMNRLLMNEIVETCIRQLQQIEGLKVSLVSSRSSLSNVGKALLINQECSLPIYAYTDDEPASKVLEENGKNQDRLVALLHTSNREASRLRELGVQFVDTAGNTFVSQPGCHLLITGKRPHTARSSETKIKATKSVRGSEITGKAFQPAGLKVIFALLSTPDLAAASLRTVAEVSDVSLGAVSGVYNDLLAQGYFIRKDGKMLPKDKRKLASRWAESYPYMLRNKRHIGTYTTNEPEWWKNYQPGIGVQLGGEVAAYLLSRYITPINTLVYVSSDKLNLLMNTARLRRINEEEHSNNMVELYEPFWNTRDDSSLLAPALVIFGDLMATDEVRNHDAAWRIFDEHIA